MTHTALDYFLLECSHPFYCTKPNGLPGGETGPALPTFSRLDGHCVPLAQHIPDAITSKSNTMAGDTEF